MLKTVIIGSGNVAQHLAKAIDASGQATLVQLYARHPEKLADIFPGEKIISSLKSLADADIYIISVTDDAITKVSSALPFKDKLVVHTSGSVALGQMDARNRRGVFYPLQTFSKDKALDFSSVPLCLESEHEEDYAILENLADALSQIVYKIDSRQRQALHVAAVFVSNFSNHMYAMGDAICKENDIPFGILNPLIAETADKVNTLTPAAAQTGPAIRRDQQTIEKHIAFLKDDNQRNIYKTLTQSIQDNG
ncbi:Rossmann-like and DUF2520 domain-containing protein [uncultured Flavobacterium sp.]|uniref:Rossmann-like and DUF2520 domain-containing protein n=1 Tax=uncultured Flavobacterium sp. TaxID=165435 RepID=UPI0025D5F3A4|nr:Rossmann-like and DUF2520 domain-containing protein [uncultured Flavobacterium sp.]